MSGKADCIFCKIVGGEIPSSKVLETEALIAFLDIGPLAEGHLLVIPKQHALLSAPRQIPIGTRRGHLKSLDTPGPTWRA